MRGDEDDQEFFYAEAERRAIQEGIEVLVLLPFCFQER